MKKLLMIATYFPPAGGVGVFRITKYVKFLRQFDWEPVIVAASADVYITRDDALANNIPAEVALYRLIPKHIPGVNDVGIGFLLALIFGLRSIITKERPAAVFITGDPFIPLIIGLFCKAIYGLPYVIDLRDPWKLQVRSTPKNVKELLYNKITDIMEPLVLGNAEAVFCVNHHMTSEYVSEYPHLASKFTTIPNGFDADDFKDIEPKAFDNFSIVYSGKFRVAAGFRDPQPVFRAISEMRDRGFAVSFVHIGKLEEEVVNLSEEIGIRQYCSFLGSMTYNETVSYCMGADVLLLLGGGQRNEQTAKVFDYIGCGRPILAVARADGAIAELVGDLPGARLVDPTAQADITDALINTYLQERHKVGENHRAPFDAYSRERLTEVLAIHLNRILGNDEAF